MGKRERTKGREGEREVAAIFEGVGLEVRGLEGAGDHLVICGEGSGFTIHSEVKRQETARPWQWYAQADREAPGDAIALVTFRRNRSPWLSLIATTELALILKYAVYGARSRVQDLER